MPRVAANLVAATVLISPLVGADVSAQSPAGQQRAPQLLDSRQASRRLPVFSHPSVDAAWKASQVSRRPVLVFVTDANCVFCRKMVKETLSHPQIARANNFRFETAVLSNEAQPELVEKLGVKAFPTTLIVNPDGSLRARVKGFVEPARFAEQVLLPPREERQARTPHPPVAR